MSLLQHPQRPSSDHLDPSADMAVDLDRELDLSAERPALSEREGRGPGVLVAAIVTSSLVLAGIILLLRGGEPEVAEPAPPPPLAEVVAAPVEAAPVEAAPVEAAPAVASRVASRPVPAPESVPPIEPAPKPEEIMPAAIAPGLAVPHRPASAGLEPASDDGDSVGHDLPAPVFDDGTPDPLPEPVVEPEPEPVDHASDPLPGVEEPAPARDEPEPTSDSAPDSELPIDHDALEPVPA